MERLTVLATLRIVILLEVLATLRIVILLEDLATARLVILECQEYRQGASGGLSHGENSCIVPGK